MPSPVGRFTIKGLFDQPGSLASGIGCVILLVNAVQGGAAIETHPPVVLRGKQVMVEADVRNGYLQERYLALDGGSWVEVAATEPGRTLGPVSVATAGSAAPPRGTVQAISLSNGALVEELSLGEHRVIRKLALLENTPWIRVVTTFEPAGRASLHQFADRFRFTQQPDWSYSPSVGGFNPDAQYKAPLILVQTGSAGFGIVPDLAALDRDELKRCPHALDLDVPGGPVLGVGFMPARMARHSVYALDTNRLWTADRAVENAYYLLVTASARPGQAYREAVRFHWERFGRVEQAQAADQQVGTDQRYRALKLWDDWRDVVWKEESLQMWLSVPLGGGSMGGGVRTKRWGPGPSVYLTSWFNSLRTSYGMALYARRTGNAELLKLAGQTVELAVKAPGRGGAFKCIAVPQESGTIWAAGDGSGDSTKDGFLGYDMCWTAYWLLKWRAADLPGSEGILERCRQLARFMMARQQVDGLLPTRFAEDDSVQENLSRTVKAETGPVVLFLLELYSQDRNPQYLEAARKGLAFLEKEVIPKRQWYDYETFWSCSPRAAEFDVRTQQWPANNLALGQTVEAYLLAHRVTGEPHYLALGEALLDYLLLFQQCWTHPGLKNLSTSAMLLGGFTTQNSDAEWSDARQSQCGNILLDYYRTTGKIEYLERGIAALRAQFPVSPSENWAHSGYGAKAGVSSFHWGTGSGMAGIEIEEDYLRDAIVDVAAARGVGVNGLNLTECTVKNGEIRFQLSSPFAWKRPPLVVFRHTDPNRQYRIYANAAEVGTWQGKELEKGVPVALRNSTPTPRTETAAETTSRSTGSAGPPAGAPMAAPDSAATRWLNKKVVESRVLDDMESPAKWAAFTSGAPEVVDARTAQKPTERSQSVAEVTFSRERSREGRQSLRMRLPSRLDVPGPKNGRGWGSAGVRRQFDGEDWHQFNRISLWIYPDCPGWNIVALELRLYNEGEEQLPAAFGQEGETTVVLQNHEWNHVVWEIGNVARDKVTRFEISALMSGHEPEAADVLTYDLDHLELEKVDPDYIEGWDVWPGRLSYSHVGYQSGAAKNAIATGLKAGEFRLVDQATGKTVLSKAVQSVRTHLGEFKVMDFSEVRQSGSYILEAGEARTRPFRIDPDVWYQTVWKAINFLYAERCGMAIPGVHGICHRDWTVVHGDQRIVINGGWHDAGDLTQGLGNTAEIVYGLFSLAERVHARKEEVALYERLLEEARWGLDWILKTSFGDGYRNQGSVNSRWTDGIIGTSDDITSTARNSPMGNFTASAAEAIAARVLKESDPRLAAYCQKMAEADWHFAVAGLTSTNATNSAGLWRGTFDSDNVEHETAAAGVLASLDLWQATRNQRYADTAVELAGIILASQQRKRPSWDIPLLGFFYTGPGKDRILHYCHRGREQAPILALTRLCDAFPNHADWMRWYSAVALYSQYLKCVAKYTEPYGIVPASIYQADEYQSVPEGRRESFRRQVLNGIPLGEGRYLRLFPVWMDYRGHFGTILPQAQALAAAAHLRGDQESATLAQRQAEWIIGRNPFSQSAMYGEGYDFPPLYAPFPGNIAGALPVGIQTRGDHDVPYWPVQSTWTYKEVWVHPVACWIWLMRDLAGPALVVGEADSAVEFISSGVRSGSVIRTIPDHGQFRAMLPEGNYTVRCDGLEQTRVFLPAATYHLDLRPGRSFDYEVSKLQSGDGGVRIRVLARGSGRHSFRVRTDNLAFPEVDKELVLKPGSVGAVEWQGSIRSPDTPWTAVVIADENPMNRKELTGAAWE